MLIPDLIDMGLAFEAASSVFGFREGYDGALFMNPTDRRPSIAGFLKSIRF